MRCENLSITSIRNWDLKSKEKFKCSNIPEHWCSTYVFKYNDTLIYTDVFKNTNVFIYTYNYMYTYNYVFKYTDVLMYTDVLKHTKVFKYIDVFQACILSSDKGIRCISTPMSL